MLKQERLGYLILDGNESPVLTVRLRNVPLGDWPPEDTQVEFNAQADLLRQKRQHMARRRDERKWLDAVTAVLAEKYPYASMSQLVKLLPDPDRARAKAILNAEMPWEALPREQVNRQPWHGRHR